MCLFPLARRANFSFYGALLDFWPLGHRLIVVEMRFFLVSQDMGKRGRKSIYRSLSAVGHRWVSAAHNAQRTLHDGGSENMESVLLCNTTAARNIWEKAQVLSSPFPLLLQIAKTERAKDPSSLFPVRSVSFSSDGENHEQKGGAVCRRRERAYVRTDRQTQSQPPPPPQQTDGEKRKSLAAGRRRRAGRGRRGKKQTV